MGRSGQLSLLFVLARQSFVGFFVFGDLCGAIRVWECVSNYQNG
jgi:hypothetical protein